MKKTIGLLALLVLFGGAEAIAQSDMKNSPSIGQTINGGIPQAPIGKVGTIGTRSGVPVDVDQWDWTCGFYPVPDCGRPERGIEADLFTARGLRNGLAPAIAKADRIRLPRVSARARFPSLEICHMGCGL